MNNEEDESEWISEEEEELLSEEEEESLEEEVEVLSYEEEGTYIFKIFKLYLTFGTNYNTPACTISTFLLPIIFRLHRASTRI